MSRETPPPITYAVLLARDSARGTRVYRHHECIVLGRMMRRVRCSENRRSQTSERCAERGHRSRSAARYTVIRPMSVTLCCAHAQPATPKPFDISARDPNTSHQPVRHGETLWDASIITRPDMGFHGRAAPQHSQVPSLPSHIETNVPSLLLWQSLRRGSWLYSPASACQPRSSLCRCSAEAENASGYRVRRAVAADVPAIAEMLSQAGGPAWRLNSPGCHGKHLV